jgi:hypothetical protein
MGLYYGVFLSFLRTDVLPGPSLVLAVGWRYISATTAPYISA